MLLPVPQNQIGRQSKALIGRGRDLRFVRPQRIWLLFHPVAKISRVSRIADIFNLTEKSRFHIQSPSVHLDPVTIQIFYSLIRHALPVGRQRRIERIYDVHHVLFESFARYVVFITVSEKTHGKIGGCSRGIGELRRIKGDKVYPLLHTVFFDGIYGRIDAFGLCRFYLQKEKQIVVLELFKIVVKRGDLIQILRRISKPSVDLIATDLVERHRFDIARAVRHSVEGRIVTDDDVAIRREIQVDLHEIGAVLVVCRARRLHGIFVIVPVQPAHRLRISAMRNDEGAGRIDSGIYAFRRKRLKDRRCLRTQNAVCTRRKRSDALLFPFRLCIYVDEKFAYGLYFLRAQLRIGDECGFSRIAVDLRLDLCDRRAPSAEVHDAVGGRTGRAHALHQRREHFPSGR